MYCLVSDIDRCFRDCYKFILPRLTLKRLVNLTLFLLAITLIVRYILQLEEPFIQAPFCKDSKLDFVSSPPRFGISISARTPAYVGPTPLNTSGLIVLYNYLSPRPGSGDALLTLTTHVTTNFLIPELVELVEHWPDHPLSIAVTPTGDLCQTLAVVSWLWTCRKDFQLRVTFHLILRDENVARFLKNRPLLEANCDVIPTKESLGDFKTEATSHPYLINVARNVARTLALTPYVLASDVELYPSPNLGKNFESYVRSKNFVENQLAYVVPTFEIDLSERDNLPKSRQDLVKFYKTGKVIYFHALVCQQCQKFPNIQGWIDKKIKPDTSGFDTQVGIFDVVKREFPYHRWEPIFIGTNDEPLYDERLSWEGYQDKMTQMHELCLKGYNFAILDTAFLLHRPGIKRSKSKSKEDWRKYFVSENSMVYQEIMNEMRVKYGGPILNCKEHS